MIGKRFATRRAHFCSWAALLLFVVLLSVRAIPNQVEACTANPRSGEKYCALHDLAPGVLLWLNGFFASYESAIVAASTFLLFVVTSALAVYTYKLWGATVGVAHESTKSSVAQAKRMRRSIKQGARSADALERAATAWEEASNATKRMLAHTHPPKLEIESARIEAAEDGTAVIKFYLWNHGKTAATIKASYLTDSAPERYGDGVSDGIDVIGETIISETNVPVTHVCTNIKMQDRPPKTGLPRGGPVGFRKVGAPPPPPPPANPVLSGWILFTTEGGDRGGCDITGVECYWTY